MLHVLIRNLKEPLNCDCARSDKHTQVPNIFNGRETTEVVKKKTKKGMKLALGYENIYHKLQGHKVKLTLQGDIWLHLVDTHFLSFTFEVEVSFHAGHRKK